MHPVTDPELCLDRGVGELGLHVEKCNGGNNQNWVEDVHEPFLLQRGFLLRTSRGRIATKLAARHLGRLVTDGDG